MIRTEISEILDGSHAEYGNAIAWVLNALIMLSAVAIAVETMPSLPTRWSNALYGFEVFLLVVFSIEYLLRLFSAPHPLKYALSFWGLIDLLTILPAIALLTPEWQAVRVFRLTGWCDCSNFSVLAGR